MGTRSLKSNQFLFLSQQYSCTSLVKIHPFILEIVCRKAIFQQSEPSCDLENGDKQSPFFNNLSSCVTLKMWPRSPKSNQFFSMSQQYRCTSLVKILPFILEIWCRQAIFQQSEPSCDLRSPKSNQFLSLSQQYSCTSFVKIHPFILEIGCRKATFQQSEPLCDLISIFPPHNDKFVQVWPKSIHSLRR